MLTTSKCRLLAAMAACAASSVAVADEPGPSWLSRPARSLANTHAQATDEVLLVLQRERSDGAQMLTLRVPIADFGPVFAFAGAGLNRSVYFAESNSGQTFTSGHGRHRSVGPAAELGAEWRMNERLAMSANLRWIELASNASLLASGESLVAADPVSLGVSLGWRFR